VYLACSILERTQTRTRTHARAHTTAGRPSVVHSGSKSERDAISALLETIVKRAQARQNALLQPGKLALAQRKCLAAYNSDAVQGCAICVIVLSFITTCYDSQVKPPGKLIER